MKEDIELLEQEFKKIKDKGLIKSLRKGTTGVGYTFETILNKKEDQESKPDFKSIEIKCLLGYSKSDITLFSCIPKRNNESAMNYIFDNYSYYKYGSMANGKLFSRRIFSKYSLELYNWSFKLDCDKDNEKIILKSYKNGDFYENVCYWDFKELKNKLKTKMSYLAIVQAYPYRKQDVVYYKFVKINFYKLICFDMFLHLLENDIISINFYLKDSSSTSLKKFEDHGVKFRIKREDLEKLFYRVK